MLMSNAAAATIANSLLENLRFLPGMTYTQYGYYVAVVPVPGGNGIRAFDIQSRAELTRAQVNARYDGNTPNASDASLPDPTTPVDRANPMTAPPPTAPRDTGGFYPGRVTPPQQPPVGSTDPVTPATTVVPPGSPAPPMMPTAAPSSASSSSSMLWLAGLAFVAWWLFKHKAPAE